MQTETFTRTYSFDCEKTCKSEWVFTLSASDSDGPVIEDLQIKPHINDAGNQMGCQGHPKTIMILLKGLPVSSINVEALTQAGCAREVACGQVLAQCLQDLLETAGAS